MSSPAQALRRGEMLHLPARVRHTRLLDKPHGFSHGVDYILFAPEIARRGRGLLARNRFGLLSLHDKDHGGSAGRGAAFVWAALEQYGIGRTADMVLGLLTQPRWLGFGFNPVSFWLLWRGDGLIAAVAEVNNTWGQRHSYLCHLEGGVISAKRTSISQKLFHVSPFQDLGGDYHFRFAVEAESLDILIRHHGPRAGLVARMQGRLLPLQQGELCRSLLRRPGGALRVLALIYAHALRLKRKGIAWRPLPPPPAKEISE